MVTVRILKQPERLAAEYSLEYLHTLQEMLIKRMRHEKEGTVSKTLYDRVQKAIRLKETRLV